MTLRLFARASLTALALAATPFDASAQAPGLLTPQPMSWIPWLQAARIPMAARKKIDYAPTSAIIDPQLGEAVLRHLPNNIQGYRLDGESGASEWPIYLSETQALRRLKFRVGYLSAVAVMPEASTLTVSVNDTVIGETHIAAPNKAETKDFDVPPALLRPGFNAVRIAVDQRHRVDCSLGATNELWTQIDPTKTGLLIPGSESGVHDIADIAALPPDAQGALPIRAVLPGHTSPANVERMIRAVQIISTHGRFEQPAVDVGPLASGDYGVNLVVGLFDDVAKLADLDGALNGLGRVDGPRLALLAPTPSRRATIVVTGLTEDDVNKALSDFAREPEMKGSAEGLRAAQAFPGYRIAGGQTLRLRDLGLHSQEFSGRFFRTGFNIVLPADFYPANYAKVPLSLSGGYAAGLARGSQILVSINGRDALSAPLPSNAGGVFKDKTLPLPLGFFRPGLNRIEIAAQVPTPEDASCDPTKALEQKKRFMLLDSTQLRIPDLARIGRAPDLAVTATGGFPFIGLGKQPKMFMPQPDAQSIAAAATLAGRMAASAGRPIDFRFTLTPPPEGSGATLAIVGAKGLDEDMAKKFGLDPQRLRDAWRDRLGQHASAPEENLSDFDARARARLVLQNNLPAACHMSKRLNAKAPAPQPAPPQVSVRDPESPENRDLVAAWARESGADVALRKTISIFASAGAGVSRVSRGVWAGARQLAAGDDDEAALKNVYRPGASLLIAQAALGNGADDVWTLVSAPNSELMAESMNCLSDPRVWRQVEGRVASLDASDGQVSHLSAGSLRFVATQKLSVSNLRLIAASWLSLNSSVYVALALAAALLFGVATFGFVRSVGRKQECE